MFLKLDDGLHFLITDLHVASAYACTSCIYSIDSHNLHTQLSAPSLKQ